MTRSGGSRARDFDYLCAARETLFGWVRAQPAETYRRSFPVGLGSISATLVHVAGIQWGHTQWLLGRELAGQQGQYPDNPFSPDRPPAFEQLVTLWGGVNPETHVARSPIPPIPGAASSSSRSS